MFPIRTQQPRVPWTAVVLMNMLWFSYLFYQFACQNALVFTLRKFTSDTRLLAFMASLTMAFAFILGPTCNFLSDRIWTKLGRRRPFIIFGFAGSATAMAFVPSMNSLSALIVLIVIITMTLDIHTPLEPLCMEVVPPEQRGRSMACRQVLINVAILLYFQVLFPVFDDTLHVPDAIPLLGGWSLTGERLIYYMASGFFLMSAAFLLLLVREVKVPTAPNIPLSQIKFRPIAGIKDYFVSTFGDKRWLWIFLLYVVNNNIFFATWGGMEQLLVIEQFGYSKPTSALMSLPFTVLNIALLMPFMGWYSDKMRKFPAWGLAAVIVTGLTAAVVLGFQFAPANRAECPSVLWLMVIGTLITLSGAAFFVLAVQLMLKVVGPVGARVWVVALSTIGQGLFGVAAWVLIRYFSPAEGPSVMVWFMFIQFRNCFRDSATAVAAPVIFDFVPKDKMGTISSGFGFTSNLVQFSLANLGGWWIFYLSGTLFKGEQTNYATNFLLHFVISVVATVALVFFLRAFSQRKIIEYGRLGYSSTDQIPEDVPVPTLGRKRAAKAAVAEPVA